MKQPDETPVGKRKTLPVRTARKLRTGQAAKRRRQSRNLLDRDVEQELVKVFGEK